MNSGTLFHAPLKRCIDVIGFMVSPVDSASPGGFRQQEACRLGGPAGPLGQAKLILWMAVSILLPILMSHL